MTMDDLDRGPILDGSPHATARPTRVGVHHVAPPVSGEAHADHMAALSSIGIIVTIPTRDIVDAHVVGMLTVHHGILEVTPRSGCPPRTLPRLLAFAENVWASGQHVEHQAGWVRMRDHEAWVLAVLDSQLPDLASP